MVSSRSADKIPYTGHVLYLEGSGAFSRGTRLERLSSAAVAEK